ncbi:hypothetical protein QL093DRAFT_2341517 [Fusarium oxysporum]|nr:hypothetical protein QL093DRAFT_2341517 [Fusarium oxysporum]
MIYWCLSAYNRLSVIQDSVHETPESWFCFDILGQPRARKRLSENAKPASQKTGWD